MASTISSSLESSVKVAEKAETNINNIEKAEKDIQAITGSCDEISKKSQKIKRLSDGITNKIEEFNKTTIDKLKKFIKESNIEDQSKKGASEKIDDLEDEISKQKLNNFYLDKKFSAEKSEGSNETIQKLIDKISNSNVDQTKFVKLLGKIVKDQNKMNKKITKSSQKISKLAGEIKAKHVKEVEKFCTKIANTLATVKTNEQTLLEIQNSHKEELLSKVKKLLTENFGTKEKAKAFLEKEKYYNLSNYFFPDEEDFQSVPEEGDFIELKEVLANLQFKKDNIDNTVANLQSSIDVIVGASNILNNIQSINNKCIKNISEIQNEDIKDIKDKANEINGSIERLQKYSQKLKVETINKSEHIVTTSAGIIIGGVIGSTAGFPVTLAAGGAVLLGTALYKIIKHYKNDKN